MRKGRERERERERETISGSVGIMELGKVLRGGPGGGGPY